VIFHPIQLLLISTALLHVAPLRSCVIVKFVTGTSCHDHALPVACSGDISVGLTDATDCSQHSEPCVCQNAHDLAAISSPLLVVDFALLQPLVFETALFKSALSCVASEARAEAIFALVPSPPLLI